MSSDTIGNGSGTYDVTGSQGGTITVGNGNDTVVVTGGSGQTITVGNGNDSLTVAGATDDSIKAGNGNDTVVVTGGSGQTITVGNGNDSVTVTGATGDTIKAGNGSDTVTVSGGSGNTIAVGNGNETVVASADHADTITVGNGNDTVYLGANDTVTVGKGNDMVVVPSSMPTLTAPASITVLEDQSIGMGLLAGLSATGFGRENIYGFAANDKIEVSTAQFANFAAVLADAKQVGQNTVVTADPLDTITLENFQLSSLKSSNLMFTTGGSSTTVSLTISGLPSDATLSSALDPSGVTYDSTTGTWTVAAGALPDLALHAGEVTTATLTVTATDYSISQAIALTVDPIAPTLTAPASLSVVQGQTVALDVGETPYDPRDVVSLKITGIPVDASLSAGTRNSDGSWTLTPAQLSGLTLTAGAATVTSLTVTATNMLGVTASTSDTIALTITPASTIGVAVNGTAQEGQVLTAAVSGGNGASLAYQWQSSADGVNWNNIANATGATYTVQEGDETDQLRVQVTPAGGSSATSAATAAVLDAAPTVTTPVIAGTAQEGQTLTVSASSGQNDNPVTYAWYSSADGYTHAIATGATYLVPKSDEGFEIEATATATNDNGVSITATSTATESVLDAAPTITTPTVSGTTQAGQTLTASADGGDNSVSYTWYSSVDGYTNPVATGATYTVQEGDEGASLEVTATSTNANGVSVSATSGATDPVLDAAPTITTPTITGAAQEGQTLTASAFAGESDNSVSYSWYSSADGYTSPLATGATYVVQEGDEGSTIEAKATVTNDNGVSVSAISAATGPVLDAAPTVTAPVITGTAQEGQTLTVAASAGQTDNAVSYAWYSSADNYANAIATGPTYQVKESDEGFTFEAKATVTNGNGVSVSAASAATGPVLDAAPTVTTPVITGTAQEGQTLSVAASAGQSDNAVSYAWYSSADNYTNAIAAGPSYQVKESDEGFTLEAKATVTNDNGASVSATSAATGPVLDAAPTVSAPVIAGTAQEGQTLTVAASAGKSDNAVSYAWFSSADNYTNAIAAGPTYQVKESDEGFTLEAKATVTNDNGVSVSATSAATGPVLDAAPTVTAPVITGTAQEGQTLTVAASAGQTDNAVSYAWYSSADSYTNEIAAGPTYQVKESDEGFTLEAKATVTNDNGASVTAVSAPTSAVTDDAAVSVSASVLGNGAVQQGQILVASGAVSGDSDDLAAPISYQWQSSSDGGQTWTNVAATTTGTINGVVSSLYQLGEGDEGNMIRAVASITDDTGQVVSATSAPTTAVADVPAVLSVPFSYAVDDFKVVKNGSLLGDDNFSGGPPPVAGVFSGSPVAFATNASSGASTWSEANGKAIMSSSGAIPGGVGALVQAILLTNTSPEGTGAGQSNSGLKENATFTVSTTFDLALPPAAGPGGYGIMLTNTAPGVAGTEVVELEVQRSSTGTANIVLMQLNQATNTTTQLANQVLSAAQMSGNTQIELDLAHNTANSSTITGSFELIDNGTQTAATTFAPTTAAHAFNSQTFTRAAMFATAAATAQISGTAQEGKTLTATMSANDGDAAVAYQWQMSSDNGTTWSNIAGATNSTYVVQEADEGDVLRVSVSSSDADGSGITLLSGATAAVTDKAPSVTTPIISGTPQEGQTLTASATAGEADDSVSYAWYSSQSGYTIQIGSGATYVVQEADEGQNLQVKATVTTESGATASAFSTTGLVLDAPPTVTTPTITGIAQEGQILTASANAGEPDDTITYTWYNSADNYTNPIGFGPTYQVQESDDSLVVTTSDGLLKVVDERAIEVKATVTNENGVSVSATSAPTAPVLDAAPFVSTPTIFGTAQEGQILGAQAFAAQSDNPVTYAWFNANGDQIGIGANYQVQESDEGTTITVKATATNEQGMTAVQESAATAVVTDAPPQFAQFPTLSNYLPEEGETLTVSATAAQSDTTVAYTWYSSADNYANPIGTGDSYTLQEGDEGRQIEAVATLTNDDNVTVTAASNATGLIMDAPPSITTPTIDNVSPKEGDVLTASESAVQDADDPPVVYLWYNSRDGYTTVIGGGSTYLVQESDEGYQIGVKALALNDYNPITNDGIATSSLASTNAVAADETGSDNDPNLNGIIIDGHQYFNVSHANVAPTADATIVGFDNVITPNGNTITLPEHSDGDTIVGDDQDINVNYSGVAFTGPFVLAGTGDVITGSWNDINVQAGADVELIGSSNRINGDKINVKTDDAFVTLTGNADTISGQNDMVSFTGTNGVVNGNNQVVFLGTNLAVKLNGSNDIVVAANSDTINLSNGSTVLMSYGGQNVTINGNNETIDGQVNGLYLNGNDDVVEGFSSIVYLPDGSGLTLKNVGGFTTINGNNETVNAPDPTTSVILMGSGDTINGSSVNILMQVGSSATLVGSSQDFVNGNNDILYADNETFTLLGNNSAPLVGANAPLVGNTVIGSNDTITSNSAAPSAATTLTIQGTNDKVIGNNQTITIADGASVELPGVFGDAVTFGGSTGTLLLDQSATFNAGFQNSIAGFTGQDQLDLRDLVYDPVTTNASFTENNAGTGGTLTVTTIGSNFSPNTSASLLLYGDYTTANFALASDGHGGTLVTDPPTTQQTTLAQSHT